LALAAQAVFRQAAPTLLMVFRALHLLLGLTFLPAVVVALHQVKMLQQVAHLRLVQMVVQAVAAQFLVLVALELVV
jgi:hypothetical protein